MSVYLAADDEPAIVLGVVLRDLLEGVNLRHLQRRGSLALRGMDGWMDGVEIDGRRSQLPRQIPNSRARSMRAGATLDWANRGGQGERGDCSAFKTAAAATQPSPPPPQILPYCYGLRLSAARHLPPAHPSPGQWPHQTHLSAAGGGRPVDFILLPCRVSCWSFNFPSFSCSFCKMHLNLARDIITVLKFLNLLIVSSKI
jgi:hypothetical protein